MRTITRPSTAKCTLPLYISFLLSEPHYPNACRLGKLLNISHDSVNRFLLRESFTPDEASVTTVEVINAFDAFSEHYQKEYQPHKIPCLIVLDNASMHHSTLFKHKKDAWMARGVCLHYLPPYSPELNLIEILWRKMKYEWLSFDAYQSYADLKQHVTHILDNIGNKYLITFT